MTGHQRADTRCDVPVESVSEDATKETGSPVDENVEKLPTDRLKTLEKRAEAHSKQLESLREQLEKEREHRCNLEHEIEMQKERIDELEKETARLNSRTDLLELVQSSNAMDGEQRSAALIQHLHRAAQKQRDRGESAKASVSRDEAEAALQYPDVERTTIYRDMERAVRLVGNESVLWYESASGGESRLKLNLETGDLPAKFTEGEEP